MKKIFIIIVVLGISFPIFAQDDIGLENSFYFRFGYSQPTNAYFGVDESSFWDDTKRVGGMFELGSIFMINSLPIADGLRLGINVDYIDITFHQFEYTFADLFLRTLKISSKVGPSLSYSPVEHLVFDVYFKAKIPWVGGIWVDDTSPLNDDYGFVGYMGFGYSTGFNVRYRALMIGFEYTKDSMKLEDIDEVEGYFGNFSDDGDKTPMSCFNFTLGLSF